MSEDKVLYEPIISQLAYVLIRNAEQKEKFLEEFKRGKSLDSLNNYIYQACVYDFFLSSNHELDEIIKAIVFDMDKEDLTELVDTIKDYEGLI